ncbi:dnaJ homolog subfamily C member 27-like, partial [Corvus kubaryi]|uniref:dnaJ homolog subfamily C member 27-like n=1 Tax=Corvus kubaryi TaxID=68294 RepID=UPI001C03F0F9
HQSRLLPNPPSPRLSRGLRGLIPGRNSQTFYSAIVDLCDNGGKRPPGASGVGFTREQADAIRRIRNSKDSWDTLGVKPGASREEVTRAYRRLAVLLHPDKCAAPGSEDAFKALGGARSALLKNIK